MRYVVAATVLTLAVLILLPAIIKVGKSIKNYISGL